MQPRQHLNLQQIAPPLNTCGDQYQYRFASSQSLESQKALQLQLLLERYLKIVCAYREELLPRLFLLLLELGNQSSYQCDQLNFPYPALLLQPALLLDQRYRAGQIEATHLFLEQSCALFLDDVQLMHAL